MIQIFIAHGWTGVRGITRGSRRPKKDHIQQTPTSKIGGWVDWKEGPNFGVGSHYPKCPDCKAPMTLPLLQLVEEEEVNMMKVCQSSTKVYWTYVFLATAQYVTLSLTCSLN